MTERPLVGFGLPISGSWATAANMTRVAQRAEDLGYASLWTFQRLLHPAEGQLGEMYRAVHDPIVVLAAVAGVTQRVRLGLAIVNAPYYSPVMLAKMLTTLDHVSSGRLDAGLGIGWSEDEYAAAGVPFERRGARMDEFLRCLEAVWTEPGVGSFDGEFYSVPPALIDPKPVQQPRPPILIGGSNAAALRRLGRVADGWISSSRQDLAAIDVPIGVIREAAQAAGRDPDALRFVVRGLARLTDDESGDGRVTLHGTAQQIRDDIAALGRQGVTEVFLDLNFDPAIGSPDADPGASMAQAERTLEALAPIS